MYILQCLVHVHVGEVWLQESAVNVHNWFCIRKFHVIICVILEMVRNCSIFTVAINIIMKFLCWNPKFVCW
jgi:hypothetical protein